MNQDFLTLSEYREDGRKKDEFRVLNCKLSIDPSADGSCYLKIGLTEVICYIKGPHERKSNFNQFISIEYSIAPFSGIDRRAISKFDKDWSEFAENLCVSFEKQICKDALGKSQIDIIVTVIQRDGSAKSAIFNAITIALLDAGIPIKDFIISTTVGILNNNLILDLTNDEQRQANAELIISFLPRQQQLDFIELKCSKITKKDSEDLTTLAINGCNKIYDILRQIVLEHSIKRMICSRQQSKQ